MPRLLPFALLMVALTATTGCIVPQTTSEPRDPPATTEPTPPPSAEVEPPSDAPDQGVTRVVIPGDRVGPVTATTSRADLVNLYGEAALEDAPIAMGEGFTEPGTIVNADSEWQFAVVWHDDSQAQPLLVKDFGPAWLTPEGLGVGVPYSTLETVLGNFQLYGFAWDYGGTVMLEDSNLDQYNGYLLLRVSPSQEAMTTHVGDYQAVMGDELFASSNAHFQPLELSVYEMVVYFD
jgi:hypothetical protein